ncbi:MAG: outer membrane protein assembly factor BamA [Desulfobacteraceae bacterium]|nr:outer membrane protein assembly factor BamA [Desulfobacteraceae bacterium]MBC2720986.1 outer membrane protein assembly factor BamA [Desulfobacteraceae bacterium]
MTQFKQKDCIKLSAVLWILMVCFAQDPAYGFQVTPYPRIKDIKISGAFPLLEREILNAMQLYPGDVYHPKTFSGKEAVVAEVFKNEGYIAPVVNLDAAEDPTDGNFVVYVTIDKGDFFHIRRFEITGNRAFSTTRLKLRIKTCKSWLTPDFMRCFKKKVFNKDIQNLIRFYRRKGYPEIVVNSDVNKDAKTQNASIFVTIDEGPRYDIEFQGNKEFWVVTLKKDLTLFKEGNKKDFGLRKSIRKIKKRYHNAGYKDCRIEMKSERKQEACMPVRNIRLLIHEGPQYVVNSVNLTGNYEFDSKKIKKQILTGTQGFIANGAWVQETLEEDKHAVTSLYLKQGYMNTVVKDKIKLHKNIKENKAYVNITIDIKEGVQTQVTCATIHGLNVLSDSEALEAITLKKGSVFRNYMIRSDENTLSSLISEKGYPHVTVKGSAVISKDNPQAAITYEVDEGPFVRMGQVAYTGNFLTKGRVIEKELELNPGEPFSLNKFLESQRNIRDINAFDSVRFKTYGLKEKEDKVNLLLELEEKKPYYIQLGGGYDTEREFYADILAGDRNLFGLNKEIWTRTEISQIGYRGDLGMVEPRFMGTGIKSSINMFSEKREEFNTNFGTRDSGISVSFNSRLFQKFNADLSFVYAYKKQYQRDSEPIPAGEEDEYDPRGILTISPSLVYNSTDSYISPRKGMFSSLLLDFSKGINNSLDNFFKYRLEIRKYYTPMENLTFALRGLFGDITRFDDGSTIPEDQLFFLGGTSTVRGFDENRLRFDATGKAVGGKTAILGNIEARIDLGPNFELSFFYDTGSIKNAILDQDSDDFRSSVGVGLHYLTQIGPMGVYYGHKLDRKANESAGSFHFTIGFRF